MSMIEEATLDSRASVTIAEKSPAKVQGKISKVKSIVAITVGNGLEFFEFTSYSFFAIIIGKLFFPAEGDIAQLLMITATFGIGFIARPVGGLFLGLYADRAGRKAAMTLTLSLMAIGSAIILLAPPYAYIGVAAPVLIVLARLIQGFALGGEIGASTSLLMEYADNNSRGFYGGLQLLSQNASALAGSLLGLTLTTFLSTESLESWGWRLPFAIGLLMGPLGVFIRRNLHETLDHEAQEEAKSKSTKQAIGTIFSEQWRVILAGIAIVSAGTSAVYISMYYMPTYAKILHFPMTTGLLASCVATGAASIFAPICGMIADRVGRKKMLIMIVTVQMIVACPAFMIINSHPSLPLFLTVVGALALLATLIGVLMTVFITEMFPKHIRATGISIVYCVGVSLFGGFAPFISTLLIQLSGSNLAPSWYLIFCCVLCLSAVPFLVEKNGKSLD
ncbi:MFS transporter [Glaciimonas soli]|nr:MFS transporter [Glaciimonas soli]